MSERCQHDYAERSWCPRCRAASTADPTPAGTGPGEPSAEAVAKAMQGAWNDICADSGCFPECFDLERIGGRYVLRADFRVSCFARLVAEQLRAAPVAADARPEAGEPSDAAVQAACDELKADYPNLGYFALTLAIRAAYAVDFLRAATPPAASGAARERLEVPIPSEFNPDDAEWPLSPVDVAELRSRRNRDRVMWYEIAALCDALLSRAAVPPPSGEPGEGDVDWLLPAMRKAESEAYEGGLCSDALLRDLARAVVAALSAVSPPAPPTTEGPRDG